MNTHTHTRVYIYNIHINIQIKKKIKKVYAYAAYANKCPYLTTVAQPNGILRIEHVEGLNLLCNRICLVIGRSLPNNSPTCDV